ncbi:MAG: DUF1990 domain-containing protein [Bacteroidota bacterium]
MKAAINFPKKHVLDPFLDQQEQLSFSYQEVGQTRQSALQFYDNDHHHFSLGRGEGIWQKAKKALVNWQQFPPEWTNIYPGDAPLASNTNVLVLFKVLGIWWINSARIVYHFDEINRFGFAYGTLPNHIERGEEVFWVERDDQFNVSYQIKAFSRPAHPLVWMAYPMARFFQKRFCTQSGKRMRELVKK